MHLGAKNELSGTFSDNHKALKIHKLGDAHYYKKVLLWQIIFGQPLHADLRHFVCAHFFKNRKAYKLQNLNKH